MNQLAACLPLPPPSADTCTGPGCMLSCSHPHALNLARVPGAVRASRNGGGHQIRPRPPPAARSRRRHLMRFPFIPPVVDYICAMNYMSVYVGEKDGPLVGKKGSESDLSTMFVRSFKEKGEHCVWL